MRMIVRTYHALCTRTSINLYYYVTAPAIFYRLTIMPIVYLPILIDEFGSRQVPPYRSHKCLNSSCNIILHVPIIEIISYYRCSLKTFTKLEKLTSKVWNILLKLYIHMLRLIIFF